MQKSLVSPVTGSSNVEKKVSIPVQEIIKSYKREDLENDINERNGEAVGKDNNGLSNRVPYFRVVSKHKKVLSHKDDLVFDIEYEIKDDTPVHVFFSINDEKRGGSIFANGTKPISGKGKHKLTYVFPLKYYNDTDISVTAALDEAETRKRIALTNNANSCHFAVRNDESDNGLLRRDNNIHGHWIDHEDYMYNLKEI